MRNALRINTLYLVLISFMFLSSCKYFRKETKLTEEEKLEFKMEVEKFHKYHNRIYDIDSVEIYNKTIYIKQKRNDGLYSLEFKNFDKKTIEVTIYGASGYNVFFLNFEQKGEDLVVSKIIEILRESYGFNISKIKGEIDADYRCVYKIAEKNININLNKDTLDLTNLDPNFDQDFIMQDLIGNPSKYSFCECSLKLPDSLFSPNYKKYLVKGCFQDNNTTD